MFRSAREAWPTLSAYLYTTVLRNFVAQYTIMLRKPIHNCTSFQQASRATEDAGRPSTCGFTKTPKRRHNTTMTSLMAEVALVIAVLKPDAQMPRRAALGVGE